MQAKKDANFIEMQFDMLQSADIYSDFSCWSNFVNYDTLTKEGQVVLAYPGKLTDEKISKLNEAFGISISRKKIFETPNEMYEIIKEINSDASRRRIYHSIMDVAE